MVRAPSGHSREGVGRIDHPRTLALPRPRGSARSPSLEITSSGRRTYAPDYPREPAQSDGPFHRRSAPVFGLQ